MPSQSIAHLVSVCLDANVRGIVSQGIDYVLDAIIVALKDDTLTVRQRRELMKLQSSMIELFCNL